MNTLETTGIANWDQHCIVCGKSVDHGGGLAHFKVEGRMIAICCPLCIETFTKDPRHYLSLRKANELNTGISRPGGSAAT